jgi:hypothetical protein
METSHRSYSYIYSLTIISVALAIMAVCAVSLSSSGCQATPAVAASFEEVVVRHEKLIKVAAMATVQMSLINVDDDVDRQKIATILYDASQAVGRAVREEGSDISKIHEVAIREIQKADPKYVPVAMMVFSTTRGLVEVTIDEFFRANSTNERLAAARTLILALADGVEEAASAYALAAL